MNNHSPGTSDSRGLFDARKVVGTLALTLAAAALWGLTHRYLGLSRDAELYAMQALSRIHPYFDHDIYLANTSQDAFTIFSPLYARLIVYLGLPAASCLLFVFCCFCFLAAAWVLARRLYGVTTAWPAIGLLICTPSVYGAYGIFESPDDYLSARSLGEALVVMGFAVFYCDRRRLAFGIAVLAMLVHPLMALPGLLLLLCLTVPLRFALIGTVAGTAGTALLALAAAHGYLVNRLFVVMDPAWLEVVRERSHFLFLNYWRTQDWQLQLRPFLSLALALACLRSDRARKLCLGAVMVGVTGFVIAAIGGVIGPIALLVQGQAWRWCWLASFVAVLMLAPTVMQLWREGGCGYLSAVLLLAAWTFAPIDGTAAAGAALFLWLLNSRISRDRDIPLRYSAYSLMGILGTWTLANLLQRPTVDTGHSSVIALGADWLRGAFTLHTLAVSLFGLFAYWVQRNRKVPWVALLASLILVVVIVPGAIIATRGFTSVYDRTAFADWRALIPESTNVLLLPAPKNSGFVWFTLERMNYLSTSQSAGVVFSPVTAQEVRRRAEVLRPVMPEDWRLRSEIEAVERGQKLPEPAPLTAEGLEKICVDPQLGFVVAKEALGFGALRHSHADQWKDWNLYDCRRVRAAGAS